MPNTTANPSAIVQGLAMLSAKHWVTKEEYTGRTSTSSVTCIFDTHLGLRCHGALCGVIKYFGGDFGIPVDSITEGLAFVTLKVSAIVWQSIPRLTIIIFH